MHGVEIFHECVKCCARKTKHTGDRKMFDIRNVQIKCKKKVFLSRIALNVCKLKTADST